MSGFSAEWLALREPADAAARAEPVTDSIVRALTGRPLVRVVDLGCGTGSNARFLAPRLPAAQEWLLVDHDPILLDRAAQHVSARAVTACHDLRHLPSGLLDGRDLVTASALLDLVSDAWVAALIRACRAARAQVLFVLNYDGRMACTPADADDTFVRDAVNRHQRGDKGFGPALGPESGRRTAVMLAAAGYQVTQAQSDWTIGPEAPALQRALLTGWAQAARELAPDATERVNGWLRRRLLFVDSGASNLAVGHDDVAGTLP